MAKYYLQTSLLKPEVNRHGDCKRSSPLASLTKLFNWQHWIFALVSCLLNTCRYYRILTPTQERISSVSGVVPKSGS